MGADVAEAVGEGAAATSSASLAAMSSSVDVRSGAVSSTATMAVASTSTMDHTMRAPRVPSRRRRAVARLPEPAKPWRRTGVSTKR